MDSRNLPIEKLSFDKNNMDSATVALNELCQGQFGPQLWTSVIADPSQRFLHIRRY